MNTAPNPSFEQHFQQRRAAITLEHRERRLAQLVRLIDELSGEMSSSDFRDAIRTKGYDIDACTPMLVARGVNVNN